MNRLFGKKFFQGANTAEILEENKTYRCNNQSFKMIADEFMSPTKKVSDDGTDLIPKSLIFNFLTSFGILGKNA